MPRQNAEAGEQVVLEPDVEGRRNANAIDRETVGFFYARDLRTLPSRELRYQLLWRFAVCRLEARRGLRSEADRRAGVRPQQPADEIAAISARRRGPDRSRAGE